MNKLSENVYILHKAISYKHDKDGFVYFKPGENSTVGKVVGLQNNTDDMRVECTTLSKIRSKYQIDMYTLVADIEGNEVEVFRKESEALKNCRQLIVELHDTVYKGEMVTVDEMLYEIVKKLGFELKDRYGNVVYLSR